MSAFPLCGLKSDVSRGPRMGWTGRAPAPNGSQSAPGACQERITTMPRTTTLHAVTAIGIDMGKNTLHLIGLDARGAVAREGRARTHRIAACEPATLPHWHRSGNGDALCCSRACRAWPQCEAGSGHVCKAVSAGAQE